MKGNLIRQQEHPGSIGIFIPTLVDDHDTDCAVDAYFAQHPWGGENEHHHRHGCYWTVYKDHRTAHVIERPSA